MKQCTQSDKCICFMCEMYSQKDKHVWFTVKCMHTKLQTRLLYVQSKFVWHLKCIHLAYHKLCFIHVHVPWVWWLQYTYMYLSLTTSQPKKKTIPNPLQGYSLIYNLYDLPTPSQPKVVFTQDVLVRDKTSPYLTRTKFARVNPCFGPGPRFSMYPFKPCLHRTF